MEKKTYPPGIYTISNEHYHQSVGISRSGIMEFKRSPKHYWYKYVNPNHIPAIPTYDMEFGTAVHAYILEPEKFDQEYVVKPDKREKLPEVPLLKDVGREEYDKAKKIYEDERIKRKNEDADFYRYSLGKKQIDKEDLEKIKLMSASIMEDPQTSALITGAQYEKSIYWIDEETKLICKCRPDIMHANFMVDLKTARDASPRTFQREFYDRSYHIQLAMNHMAIKAITGQHITDFIDLVIEKDLPYATAIYPIDEVALEHGINEVHYYLQKIKECFDNNEWPSYSIQTLTLPAYAKIGE